MRGEPHFYRVETGQICVRGEPHFYRVGTGQIGVCIGYRNRANL